MDIEEIEPQGRASELVGRLAQVWERSVRATHGFLSEDDIAGLRPEVAAGLAAVGRLAVAWQDGVAVGFAGAQDSHLEMLFVDDAARGDGVGGALLAHAVMRWGVRTLDVNEQNPLAAGFYERAGFVVVGRSPVDGAGRPFPLLHMRLRLAGEAGVPGTAGGSTRSPASPPAQGAGLPGSPVPSRKAAARAASASAGGAWFDSADPALMRDHIRACEVMARFNAQQGMLDADRMKMLHGFLGAVGEGSSLSTGAQVDYGYNLFLGRNCFFNFNCTFLDGAPITFGDDVGVGPGCSFVTPLHPLLARERARCEDAGGTGHVWERSLPITVESGVWIAANVTVNAGVTIGEGAVIGSGSVVTRDIPPRTLAYGNPCRPVRAITEADSVADALAEAGLV
ncbi:hypothetical protein C1877_03660 [Gordonibacter pamelaeae]|uniref:N-acetyltransferase domain-containing protein n=3 Tax=Gordonibacter TaxID=644652 RepID=A0A369M758_9ACTN|nr:GNAT family N-acetyltransferase [Gordonibacter pamelaeae]RDB66296.1 hypothetical protein C1877_03660 [Gordonibacter pamelaeae]